MKKIILVCLLSFSIPFYSQESKALFGIIRDSLELINNAHILNLNSRRGTLSGADGSFKIFVKIGDTIAISSIQHQEKKYKIKDDSFSFQGLELYLISKIYQLEEIKIKRHDLAGILGIDINAIPKAVVPEINAVTLGLPNAGGPLMSQVDREIYTASDGALMLISNILSGNLKVLKKKKKIQQEEKEVALIYSKMRYYLTKTFNIKKEDEYRFLYYCRTDTLFSKRILQEEFTLIEFLQKKAIEFNQL
jgi:hypothetical protein